MNATRPPLDEAMLKQALASRSVTEGAHRRLVADVMAAVETTPQRKRWSLGVGRQGHLVPVVVALLLTAMLAASFAGGRAILDELNDANDIVFASAEYVRPGSATVGDDGVFIVSAGGGEPRRLATVPGDAFEGPTLQAQGDVFAGPPVRWSPDGNRLAFRLDNDVPGLYVMDRDGSDLRLVAEAHDEVAVQERERGIASFAWSPDSSRIAFISPNLTAWPPGAARNGRLYVVDVASGSVRQVNVAANGTVAWSPDGSRIAHGRTQPSRSALVIINADGTGERSFTHGVSGNSHPGAVTWSPDGSHLAYIQTRFGGSSPDGDHLMVVNADGTDARRVEYWQSGCCYHGAFGGLLEWSPDGTRLATLSWTADGPEIRMVAANGSGSFVPVPGDWFDWSPDGSQLVVARRGEYVPGRLVRRTSIYIVDADGSDERWLAEGDYPAWSP